MEIIKRIPRLLRYFRLMKGIRKFYTDGDTSPALEDFVFDSIVIRNYSDERLIKSLKHWFFELKRVTP